MATSYLNQYLHNTLEADRSSAAIAYLAALDHLNVANPTIAGAIVAELRDQRSHLKLIASENYCSLATQLAMGNLLTDKYSEGFPHHRFYAGCDNVDTVEDEAVNQLKQLYGCDHAYVQPHSGADANLVAFWAVLTQRIQDPLVEKLGYKNLNELSDKEYESIRKLIGSQRLLGMSLNSGGHLTHGYRHNVSSKIFEAHAYDVDKATGLLNYVALAKQAQAVKPLILLAGYSAYPRKINFANMREIADSVGAVLMVDMAHFSGLVAGKVFTGEYDPIPHAHIVTSTSHKTLRGPRGGFVLCTSEFADTVNKGCPMVLGGPLPHVMAAKAVAFREANTASYRDYAHAVVQNAQALAEGLIRRGATVLTGGTDNHLLLFDVTPFGLTGRQAELAFREAAITVNRNAIPFDPNGAWYTSGVRIGTPAMTTLGMGITEMDEIADIMVDVLKEATPAIGKDGAPSQAKYTLDVSVVTRCRSRVKELLKQYPLYPEITLGSGTAVAWR